MKPIVITGPNFRAVYERLFACFYQLDPTLYQSRVALIHLKSVSPLSLPSFSGAAHLNELYQEFTSSAIDQRWDFTRSDWYFSYAERLIKPYQGISQLTRAVETLTKDPHSRSCLLVTNNNQLDTDLQKPALTSVQFELDPFHNRLNMLTCWRSNHLQIAFPLNVYSMASFMRLFLARLNGVYPGLKAGSYTHFVNSLHSYPSPKYIEYVKEGRPPDLMAFCEDYAVADIEKMWSVKRLLTDT